MLRVSTKEKIIQIIDNMVALHLQCQEQMDETVLSILQDCQQAAIAVGENVERETENSEEVISLLERYCEEIYDTSQNISDIKERSCILNRLLTEIKAKLEKMPAVYRIAFFPYKASMWDSLESIWIAAKEDSRCECKVVPIPYYHYQANSKEWLYTYEGADFPEDVPIVDYRDYLLEQEVPDVAYIHNPYDEANYVTSVDRQYYSCELKKYVGKLVYVPYYVTSGFVQKEHLNLPVYRNMDFMVVQSEYFKECFKGKSCYSKLLPLGSPKLDRVIRLSCEGVEMPEEWKPVIGRRKTLMLNTSIACFLYDGDIYIQKLMHLFQWIKTRNDVSLIWRPHPLLVSTIQSMRPHLMKQYEVLLDYFNEEKIGVLDTNPDITKTVAIADAYIGESATSVINLFGAAGKPIFILNNYMTGKFMEEEQRRFKIADFIYKDGKWWMTSMLYNGLFTMENDWEQIACAGQILGQPKWRGTFGYICEKEKLLYLSPRFASMPVSYQKDTNEYINLWETGYEEILNLRKVVSYHDKLFYLPTKTGSILEYNTATGKWKEHIKPVSALKQNIGTQIYEDTVDCKAAGRYLWVTVAFANRILRFDMVTEEYQIFEVGDSSFAYSGIEVDGDELYLAEVHTGDIIRWNCRSDEIRTYRMPKEFHAHYSSIGRHMAIGRLINMGGWMIASPCFANCMVKIDKKSGETSLLIPDFWKNADQPANGFHPLVHGTAGVAKKLNDSILLVQRSCDDAVALVYVETEEYTVHYPTIAKRDFENMINDEDGFEKIEKYQGFFRSESAVFSLEGFVDDLVNNRLEEVKKRQKEALVTMAVNLDGTCGQKVHNYIISTLEAAK